MPKKRGKSRPRVKARGIKRKSAIRAIGAEIKPVPTAPKREESEFSREIDNLLKNEDSIKQELQNLESKELSLEEGEQQIKQGESRLLQQSAKIQKEEKKIEQEAKKILGLEQNIKESVTIKPLGKITGRDINKGLVGAFFGTIAHFAFIYGREIARDITNERATVLYIFSYFLLTLLMYRAGYREIEEKKYLELFPLRATILYLLSIFVVIFVFLLYNQIDAITLGSLYREVSVVSILAVLGAGTADMIGRD